MKNRLGKSIVVGFALASAFLVAACSNGSGTSASAENAESFDDLPNCTESREGETIRVEQDKAYYICQDKRWVFFEDIIDTVKTQEDLPNCSAAYEKVRMFVNSENAIYGCSSQRWTIVWKPMTEYMSEEEMPACSPSRDGDSAYVKSESSIYICYDEVWKLVSAPMDSVNTYEDLRNCTDKNEGDSAFVKQDASLAFCREGIWENYGTIIASDDELKNCTSTRELDKVFVQSSRKRLVCYDGIWMPYSEWKELSQYNSSSSIDEPPYYDESSSSIYEPSYYDRSSSSIYVPSYSSSSSVKKQSSSSSAGGTQSEDTPLTATPLSNYNCSGDNLMFCGDDPLNPDADNIQVKLKGFTIENSDPVGYWYGWSNMLDGGDSYISWPAGCGDCGEEGYYGVIAWQSVHDYKSLHGTAHLYTTDASPYAGVAFDIVPKGSSANISTKWGGLCVVYKSTQDITLEIRPADDVSSLYDYQNPKVILPATSTKSLVDAPWSAFKSSTVNTQQILQQAVKIAFTFNVGTTDFYIYALDVSGNCN